MSPQQRISASVFRQLVKKKPTGKRKAQRVADDARCSSDAYALHLVGVVHPPINEWKTWHWSKYRLEKQRWERLVARHCGNMRRWPADSHLRVEVVFRFADSRRHDPDGYAPKFILDGLVAARILPDDHGGIVHPLVVYCLPGTSDSTTVRITPCPESSSGPRRDPGAP